MSVVMKGKFLKVINPVFFIIMAIQIVSGLAQRYASQDAFIFFRRVHILNSWLVVLVFVIHLYLNWAWIKGWIKTSLLRSRAKN
jgi:hypothetical protein